MIGDGDAARVWMKAIEQHGNKTIWAQIEERLRLSAEEVLMLGPLAFARSWDDSPLGVLEGLYNCIESELRRDLRSFKPVVVARALITISWAYEFLIRAGYTEDFTPLLNQLLTGFAAYAETVRRQLLRKMLSADDEQADEIMGFLLELIEKGGWASHERDLERLRALVRAVEDHSSPPLAS
jgi:hypothetical protein